MDSTNLGKFVDFMWDNSVFVLMSLKWWMASCFLVSLSKWKSLWNKYNYMHVNLLASWAENMKTVGPSVRDRQIFGRTDKFFNLSVRLTDKKLPIILGDFMPDR